MARSPARPTILIGWEKKLKKNLQKILGDSNRDAVDVLDRHERSSFFVRFFLRRVLRSLSSRFDNEEGRTGLVVVCRLFGFGGSQFDLMDSFQWAAPTEGCEGFGRALEIAALQLKYARRTSDLAGACFLGFVRPKKWQEPKSPLLGGKGSSKAGRVLGEA